MYSKAKLLFNNSEIQSINNIVFIFLCFILIFFKFNKEKDDDGSQVSTINKNLPGIIKTIEEFSDEQRDIVRNFKHEMEKFTEERSLETCLQALTLSMQLANIREKLLEAYKHYSALLENELKNQQKKEKKEHHQNQ